jgi:hypothetical protein
MDFLRGVIYEIFGRVGRTECGQVAGVGRRAAGTAQPRG